MQRLISFTKTFLGAQMPNNISTHLNLFQYQAREKLLPVYLPTINPICGFKVKGRVRRRCKSCYFVTRQERLYVICPEHPRHKQMVMKQKPHNTWLLTHASQSKVRPW